MWEANADLKCANMLVANLVANRGASRGRAGHN